MVASPNRNFSVPDLAFAANCLILNLPPNVDLSPILRQIVKTHSAKPRLEVNANVSHRWRREHRQGRGNAFPGYDKERWSEGQITESERKVGH